MSNFNFNYLEVEKKYSKTLYDYDFKSAYSKTKKDGIIVGYSLGGFALMFILLFILLFLAFSNASSAIKNDSPDVSLSAGTSFASLSAGTSLSASKKKSESYDKSVIVFLVILLILAIVGPSLMWALGAVGAQTKYESFLVGRGLIVAKHKLWQVAFGNEQPIYTNLILENVTEPTPGEVQDDIAFYTYYYQQLADKFNTDVAKSVRGRKITDFALGGIGVLFTCYILTLLFFTLYKLTEKSIFYMMIFLFDILLLAGPALMWSPLGAHGFTLAYDALMEEKEKFILDNKERIINVESRVVKFPELYKPELYKFLN